MSPLNKEEERVLQVSKNNVDGANRSGPDHMCSIAQTNTIYSSAHSGQGSVEENGDDLTSQRETVFAADEISSNYTSHDAGDNQRTLREWEDYEHKRSQAAENFSKLLDKVSEELQSRISRKGHETSQLAHSLEKIAGAHRTFTNGTRNAFAQLRSLSAASEPHTVQTQPRRATTMKLSRDRNDGSRSESRHVGFAVPTPSPNATRRTTLATASDAYTNAPPLRGSSGDATAKSSAGGNLSPITPFTPYTPAPLGSSSPPSEDPADYESPAKPVTEVRNRWNTFLGIGNDGDGNKFATKDKQGSTVPAVQTKTSMDEDTVGAAKTPNKALVLSEALEHLVQNKSLTAVDVSITAFVECLAVREAMFTRYIDQVRSSVAVPLQESARMFEQTARGALKLVAETKQALKDDTHRVLKRWKAFQAALAVEEMPDRHLVGTERFQTEVISSSSIHQASETSSFIGDKWLTQKMYGDAVGDAHANRHKLLQNLLSAINGVVEVERWRGTTLREIFVNWSAAVSVQDEMASATVADLHHLIRLSADPSLYAAQLEDQLDQSLPGRLSLLEFPASPLSNYEVPDSPRWAQQPNSNQNSQATALEIGDRVNGPAFYHDKPLRDASNFKAKSKAAAFVGLAQSATAKQSVAELTGTLDDNIIYDCEQDAPRRDEAKSVESNGGEGLIIEPSTPPAPMNIRTTRAMKCVPGTTPYAQNISSKDTAELSKEETTVNDWKKLLASNLNAKAQKQAERQEAFDALSRWLEMTEENRGPPPQLDIPTLDAAVTDLSEDLPPLYDVPSHAISVERYLGQETLELGTLDPSVADDDSRWAPTALIISPQGNLHVMPLNPEDRDSLEPEPPLLSAPLENCETSLGRVLGVPTFCLLQVTEGAPIDGGTAASALRIMTAVVRKAVERPKSFIFRFAEPEDATEWQLRLSSRRNYLQAEAQAAQNSSPAKSLFRYLSTAAGRS